MRSPRVLTLQLAGVITLYILITATISAAGQQTDGAVNQIRSVLRAQQDAWNRGDIDGFMNGYARSGINCLYFGRHNQTWLANRMRSVQEKVFQSRKDGDPHVF